MTQFAAHFNVLKEYMMILEKSFLVNQIDDFPSGNIK